VGLRCWSVEDDAEPSRSERFCHLALSYTERSMRIPLFGILLLLGQTLLSVRDVLFLNVRLAYQSACISYRTSKRLFRC
jgi:hypothetical protein